MEVLEMYVVEADEQMNKSVNHLTDEMGQVRAGKANVSLVAHIQVTIQAYNSVMPLNQTANITTPDAKTIMIKPWDKTVLHDIEKALMQSNIGINPQNDGEQIRLNIPPLTEERRKELVKQIRQLGEQAKISLRNARHDALHGIKNTAKEEHISEDSVKEYEEKVTEMTKDFGKQVDNLIAAKETEIMTV